MRHIFKRGHAMRYSLAIRYCGGCRVGYDRAAVARALLDGLRDRGLEVFPEYDEPAPVGILVCGCAAQCLLRDETLPAAWHYIGPGGLFDSAPLSLEAAIERLHNELAGPSEPR